MGKRRAKRRRRWLRDSYREHERTERLFAQGQIALVEIDWADMRQRLLSYFQEPQVTVERDAQDPNRLNILTEDTPSGRLFIEQLRSVARLVEDQLMVGWPYQATHDGKEAELMEIVMIVDPEDASARHTRLYAVYGRAYRPDSFDLSPPGPMELTVSGHHPQERSAVYIEPISPEDPLHALYAIAGGLGHSFEQQAVICTADSEAAKQFLALPVKQWIMV